jgi:hypothetical protein
MAKRRPFIGYRLRLVLAAGVVALAGGVVAKFSAPDPEILLPADFTLYRDPRPRPEQKPGSIVFLGSSEVGGLALATARQLPAANAVNLATGRGNILGFMAIASQLKEFHPKQIVVGLESSVFYFDPAWSPAAVLGADSLKGYIPDDVFEKVERLKTWRYSLFYRTLAILNPFHRFISLMTPSTPPDGRVPLFAKPQTWEDSGLDPYWGRRSSEEAFSLEPYLPELIQGFTRLARDVGTKVVFVLTPMRLLSHDGGRTWADLNWRERMLGTLRAQGAAFFDYFDAFFNGREYARGFFKKTDHLFPRAADALAVRLLTDLASEPSWRPIASAQADPCATDLAGACAGAQGSEQESCLLRQFDTLSPTCRDSEVVTRYVDPCYLDRLRLCGNDLPKHWIGCLNANLSVLSASCGRAISRVLH